MNKLLKDLKTERVQGSSAVLNYSNFDYWVNWDDIVEIVENHKQPSLNENQQIVLEWLKDDFKESGNPVDSLESLASEVLHVETFQTCISSTYDELSISEQFQVLAAFAEWGMENEQ